LIGIIVNIDDTEIGIMAELLQVIRWK